MTSPPPIPLVVSSRSFLSSSLYPGIVIEALLVLLFVHVEL
jgi:hypothetical protein